MKNSVLFIADGSIKNPILHSQGIPLYNAFSEMEYECIFLTFERKEDIKDLNEIYFNFFNKQSKIKFIHVVLTKNRFWPAGIQNIVKGVYKLFITVIRENIKIIHARSFTPTLISIIVKILLLGKVSVLFDNRGVLIEEEIFKGNWKKDSVRVKVLIFVEKKMLQYVNKIVVVSNFFKNYLMNKYSSLNLEEKTSVIPNATKIDPKKVSSSKIPSKIVPVYSGSTAPWQRTDEIFKLFLCAKNISSNFRFKIITYESIVFEKKLIKFPSISKDIEIINVPSNKVYMELSKCSFGILIRDNNIVNNVASPLKFAEYLVAGLPVIVSENVGDTEEIIKKYNVGVILRDNNYEKAIHEIIELLKDEQIKERCRMVAEKEFNIDKSIKKYISIYKELLQ